MEKKKTTIEEKDPDWMYKPILNGAFSGRQKATEDSIGNYDIGEGFQ